MLEVVSAVVDMWMANPLAFGVGVATALVVELSDDAPWIQRFFAWLLDLDSHNVIGFGAFAAAGLLVTPWVQLRDLRIAGLPVSGLLVATGVVVLAKNNSKTIRHVYADLSGLKQVLIWSLPAAGVVTLSNLTVPKEDALSQLTVVPIAYSITGLVGLYFAGILAKKKFS